MIQSSLELITTGNTELIAQELKTLYNTPTIGMPVATGADPIFKGVAGSTMFSLLVTGNPTKRGIPVYTYKYSEQLDAQIGQQIMLRGMLGGVQVVTDNYAPLPRIWKVEGYIKPISLNFGTLSGFSAVSNLIGTAAQKSLIVVIKWYLRTLRDSRTPFYFYTKEGEKVQVVAKNITFIDEPETENVQKITLELHEFITLSVSQNGTDFVQNVTGGSTPPAGTAAGMANPLVQTAVVNTIMKPAINLWENPAYVLSEVIGILGVAKGTYTISERAFTNAAKFIARATRGVMAIATISQNLFADLLYRDEGGVLKHYAKVASEISTEFGTVQIEISKMEDNHWWITEQLDEIKEEIVEPAGQAVLDAVGSITPVELGIIGWKRDANSRAKGATASEGSSGNSTIMNSRLAFEVPLHIEQQWSTMLISPYSVDNFDDMTDEQVADAISKASVVTVWNN